MEKEAKNYLETVNKMMNSADVFLSIAQVSKILKTCPKRLKRQIEEAPETLPFPVVKIGKRKRVLKTDLIKFLQR